MISTLFAPACREKNARHADPAEMFRVCGRKLKRDLVYNEKLSFGQLKESFVFSILFFLQPGLPLFLPREAGEKLLVSQLTAQVFHLPPV